jgi:hypothetical protein
MSALRVVAVLILFLFRNGDFFCIARVQNHGNQARTPFSSRVLRDPV